MPIDKPTLAYYEDHAEKYAVRGLHENTIRQIEVFKDRLPPGGRVLELGSGGGHAIVAFQKLGFDVSAIDGSAELAKIAGDRSGIDVAVMDFEALDDDNIFDGIWANASLTHVPAQDMAAVVTKVAKALKPGGYLFASFKEAESDWTDKLGRLFGAMTEDQLRDQLEAVGLKVVTLERQEGSATEGGQVNWLAVTALKRS